MDEKMFLIQDSNLRHLTIRLIPRLIHKLENNQSTIIL